MQKQLVLISVLFLSIQLWGVSEAEVLTAEDELTLEDFQLYNTDSEVVFSLYQPMTEVLELLGKPEEEKVVKHYNDENHDFIRFFYQGISVGYFRYEFTLESVDITEKNYRTYRGIAIGDSKNKVLYHYGKESLFFEEDDESKASIFVYQILDPKYNDYGSFLSIAFSIKNDEVIEIAIYISSPV